MNLWRWTKPKISIWNATSASGQFCPANAFRRYGNRMSKFGSTSMHEFGVGGAVFSFTWGLAVAEAAAAKTVDGVGCAGATCCCMVAFWKQVWSLTLILNQLLISRKDTTHNIISSDECQTYSTKLLALSWKRALLIGREVPMTLGSCDRSHGKSRNHWKVFTSKTRVIWMELRNVYPLWGRGGGSSCNPDK